ncbi:MAG: EAL domain-containing protein [Pseudomonadota bacterium]
MKTHRAFTSRKPQPGTMLIIDDDAGIRGLIRSVAERQGFEVTDCGRSEDAADAAEARGPAVITREISKSANARTLVSALVELAHNFDMSACAEGIEDEDTLGFLTDAGCDTGQGFLFSPAVPAQQLIGLIESANFSTPLDAVPHSA